jgi:quercetin dioxygenase-like cupin family protein
LASSPEMPLRAEIVTVVKGSVLLQLLEKPTSLSPGEACEVTIDTTVPADF